MRSAETQESLRARQKRAARGSMLRDNGNLWGKFRETAQARHEREKARAAKSDSKEKKRTSPKRKVKEATSLVGEYIRAAPGVAPRRSVTANPSFNPSVLRSLAEQDSSSDEDSDGEGHDSFPRPAGGSAGGSVRSGSPSKSGPPPAGGVKGGSPASRVKPIRRNSNLLRGTASFGAPASSPSKSESAMPTQFEVSPDAKGAEGADAPGKAKSPEPATTRAAARRAAARRAGGGSTWNNSTNPSSVSTTSKAGISRATGPQALAAALRSNDPAAVEAAQEELARRQAARKRAKAVGEQAKRIAEMRARRVQEANPRSAAVWAEANVGGFGGPASPPMDGREIGRVRDMAGNDAAPPLHTGDAHTPYTHVEHAHFASFRGETPGSPTSPRRRPPGAAADHPISEQEAAAAAHAMAEAPEWNPYFQHRRPGTVNMSRRFQYDKHVHEPEGSPLVGPTLMQKVGGTSMEGYLIEAKSARLADAAAKGARVQYSLPGSPGSTGRFSPPRLANGSPGGSAELGSTMGSSAQGGEGGSAQPPMGASGTLSEGSAPQLAPPPPPGTRRAAESPPSQASEPAAAATTPGGSSLLEMLASGNVPRELLGGDSDEESQGDQHEGDSAVNAAAEAPPPPPPGVSGAPAAAPKRPPPATPPASDEKKAPPS